MPCGSRLLHHVLDGRFPGETGQTFDPGNERFAFDQLLGAAGASQVNGLSLLKKPVKESVEERRLTHADVSADAYHSTMALFCRFIGLAKRLTFGFASGKVAARGIARLAYSSCWSLIFDAPHGSNKPIARLGYGFN